MLAKDVMQTDVVTVFEDTPIEDVLDLLVQEHISGVPVVDRDGVLVGMVSQGDLFFGRMTRPDPILDPKSERAGIRVRDIMTSPPICVHEDEPITEMAERMCNLHVHRLPVVRGGRLTGIVSSIDLCRLLYEDSPSPGRL